MSRRNSSIDIDFRAITSIVRGVENTLRQATTEEPSKRATTLSELYKDLKAATLSFETDTETEPEIDSESVPSESSEANDILRCFDHFYEAVASYYEALPSEAETMQPICTQLYANDFFPSIYALIFHRWLLLKQMNKSLNLFNLFIRGANHLFRSDLESRRLVFFQLYFFVKEDVVCYVCNTGEWTLSSETLEDLAGLVAKYHLYYDAGESCVGLARRIEPAVQSGRVGDVFYREALLLLNNVQSESSLLLILEACSHLRALDVSPKYQSRLQSALYEFSTPGGPRYPSRPVRHKAAAVLDSLFPGGAFARRIINAGFRLVHTYSWPSSIVLFSARMFSSMVMLPYNTCRALLYPFLYSSSEREQEHNYVAQTPSATDNISSTQHQHQYQHQNSHDSNN
eukprot:gb/GECH01014049.1/.p1 GENE.gb/GECH01014049.1/~~gb/GECH01014049.1/.p1  ORF type:complete len:400 (+),score=32.26 gb/GECH01014049.1/:1-1200(+)